MNALNRTVVAPLSSAIIAVLLAGLIVVGVDSVDRTLRPGEARLDASGIVEVSVNGAAFERAASNRVLGRNDRVRVVEGGAVLELPAAATVELRKGTTVMVGTGTDGVLLLEEGDLLAESGKDTLKIDGGTATVTVAGAAKLRRAASFAAGVYKGNILLDSQKDEQSLTIPVYRQAVAAGTGLLPADPEPLQLRASDAWDVRMLPEVLDVSQQLEVMGRGFEERLPDEVPQGPELFRTLVPALGDAPITPELLAGRAPAENLIGLVLVSLDEGDFRTRVSHVFGFRSEGASWGLVAADRGLNPNPVLGNLESALGALSASPVAVSPELEKLLGGIISNRGVGRGGAIDSTNGTVEVGTGTGPGSPGSGSTTTPPNTEPTTPPAGTTPPGGPKPPPSTPPKRIDIPPTGSLLDPLLEPLIDPLEGLLSGLLDGLLGTSTQTTVTTPAPAPAVAPTTTTTAPPSGGGLVGGLLNGVGGLLGG